jgi:4-hydroxybenzoate polyprenyltransferase
MVVYLYVILQPAAFSLGATGEGDKLLRLALVYASFAFLISLVREMVKDMEDMEGDRRYGCNTMPIAWGLSFSKVFTGIWLVILLVLLLVSMVYVLYFKMWWPAAYHFVFIVIPTSLCLRKLPKAIESKDFHALSIWIKLIMLTGILSMIYFKFYA